MRISLVARLSVVDGAPDVTPKLPRQKHNANNLSRPIVPHAFMDLRARFRPVGDFYQIQWAQASESQPIRLAGSLMSPVFTQEYGANRRFFHLKVGNPLAEVSANTGVNLQTTTKFV